MKLEYRKLSPEEAAAALADAPGWQIEDGKVTRTFEFKEYLAAKPFAAAVMESAEALNHHPDILIGWCKVRVSVNTHDVKGISPYDFELARQVSKLFGA